MFRHNFCRLAALVVAATFFAAPANAVEIKLARHPDYHNGKIVFTYLGDIWTANEDGSNARRLTVHRAVDLYPRFSPDGKWIAFSSVRFGNPDVFLMPAEGGRATQLTYHSGGEMVVGWSRDSKKVIFQSSRGMMFPGIPNLYEVPITGGVEQPILTDWGYWGSYSPDGQKFAFNRHPAVWWRKHYRGSYSADLWVLDLGTQKYRRIVDDKTPDEEKANNFWPMYGPGGDVYFVSDRATKAKSGTPEVYKSVNNIWKVNESTGQLTQITNHTSGSLFWPCMSADGKVIVYEENFGLRKLDVASGKSTEIKINIAADDPENNLEVLNFNGECDSYHLSPSGKRAVISVHGELFTIATEKGESRRLTNTSNVRESQPAWSPDGKWIAFVGEKDGVEQVFLCDENGQQMKQVSSGDSLKTQVRWAPNSSSLIYVGSDNKLYQYSVADNVGDWKSTVMLSGDAPFANPQLSPDGKWLSFTKADRYNQLPHVYLMPVAGGEARRITGASTYSDTGAQWTPDGKYIVYLVGVDVGNAISSANQKKSTAQLYVLPLLPEGTDPAGKGIDSEAEAAKQAKGGGKQQAGPVEVKIDFNRIDRRSRQLTRVGDNIGTVGIMPDSKTVLFTTAGTEGGSSVQSLWAINISGGAATRVLQGAGEAGGGGPKGGGGGGGFSSLQFVKDSRVLYYKQGKSLYATSVAAPTGGEASPAAPPKGGKGGGKGGAAQGAAQPAGAPTGTSRKINFNVRVDVDHRAQRHQVFLEAWRTMKHRFYDAQMHGVDWNIVRARYEPLLQHIADTEELQVVVSMMLGELNASHTGISGGGRAGAAPKGETTTRHPGFEMTPDQSGHYKVTHVYKSGPCDFDYVKLSPGDLILEFNEVPLKAGDNYLKLFTHAPAGRFEFLVNSKPGLEGAWKIRITPINVGQLGNLQYEKWVDERTAMVDRLSKGEIGYLHIRQMNEPSLRQFERDMATMAGKKALIIDQRFNPGGNIDQELLAFLQQKQYQKTKNRGSVEIPRPLRGYFGPMVVMANERSTSDAEVFPDGFKTLKLGKVVGVTTYGAVIGTGSHSLLDGSSLRTPGSGLWNVDGTNLENNGIVPDVYIDNTPEDFFRGRDAQLEKAIEVLREEMARRK